MVIPQFPLVSNKKLNLYPCFKFIFPCYNTPGPTLKIFVKSQNAKSAPITLQSITAVFPWEKCGPTHFGHNVLPDRYE